MSKRTMNLIGLSSGMILAGVMSASAQDNLPFPAADCKSKGVRLKMPELTGGNVPIASCGQTRHIAGTRETIIHRACVYFIEPGPGVVGGWDCGGTAGIDATTVVHIREGRDIIEKAIKLTCSSVNGRLKRNFNCD